MNVRIYDWDAVLDLWALKKTSGEIERLTGVPVLTISKGVWRARQRGDKRAILHDQPNEHREWPKERVELLTRLWNEGKSGGQIASIIGTTRSVVMGKVHRLRLPKRGRTRVPRQYPKRAKRTIRPSGWMRDVTARHSTPQPKTPPTEPVQEPVSLDLSLMDLAPGQCKYPHGEGPYVFCGHPVHAGSSYCEFHHRLCWTTVPDYRKRASAEFYARAA